MPETKPVPDRLDTAHRRPGRTDPAGAVPLSRRGLSVHGDELRERWAGRHREAFDRRHHVSLWELR